MPAATVGADPVSDVDLPQLELIPPGPVGHVRPHQREPARWRTMPRNSITPGYRARPAGPPGEYDDPNRLHSTTSALGAIADVGSIRIAVRCSTTLYRSVGRGSASNCARTATRRACCLVSSVHAKTLEHGSYAAGPVQTGVHRHDSVVNDDPPRLVWPTSAWSSPTASLGAEPRPTRSPAELAQHAPGSSPVDGDLRSAEA